MRIECQKHHFPPFPMLDADTFTGGTKTMDCHQAKSPKPNQLASGTERKKTIALGISLLEDWCWGWCRRGGMMLTLTTEAVLQRIGRGHALGQLDVEPEVLGGGSGHEGEGEGEELHGEVREAGGHCTARPNCGGAFMEKDNGCMHRAVKDKLVIKTC